MGTVNVLDIAFKKGFVESIIVVTTDKVYRNDNSGRAFIETDPLEGKDPYSASKVGTEAVVSAWQQIAKVSGGPKIVSVRAGNVIGGGDFADNRIIPDLIRGVMSGSPVEIRNPNSTRPWQHVLDPLHGYLLTLENLKKIGHIDSINFSPTDGSLKVREVIEIVELSVKDWNSLKLNMDHANSVENSSSRESTNLNLDSSVASNLLGWKPVYSQQKSIEMTIKWWHDYLEKRIHPREICKEDIKTWELKLNPRA